MLKWGVDSLPIDRLIDIFVYERRLWPTRYRSGQDEVKCASPIEPTSTGKKNSD
uniref:Uncharacterized protein n=1 Tax=Setaria digitata TaxID=48799 RepID=A0A915Q612_9BILA